MSRRSLSGDTHPLHTRPVCSPPWSRVFPAQHCPLVAAGLETAECPEPLCPTSASERPLSGRLGGRYPSVVAHTGSCARPSPSESLGCPFGTRSLQVVVAPCWEMALPDIIPACLASAPGPIPRRLPPVPVPISSRRASASAPGKGAWQTDRPDDATSTGAVLSRLQSFAPLQAPERLGG